MDRADAMRDVVEISHCFQDCFVFGGYVRDTVINGEAARDIDMVFSSVADRAIFERFLHNKYAIEVAEAREGYDFFGQNFTFRKLRVRYGRKGRSFDVDMSVKSKLDLRCTDHDFSCNKVYFSRTGMEVFSSEKDDHVCSPFASAVEMIKKKVFRHTTRRKGMELTPGNMCKYSARLIQRAEKMVKRGWTMQTSPGIFEVNSHGYIRSCQRFASESSCVVCSDDFKDGDACIVTNCKHIFHTQCIVKWVETGRSTITCPTCRSATLLYAPSTGITTRVPSAAQRVQVEYDDMDEDDFIDDDFIDDEDAEDDDDDDDDEDSDFTETEDELDLDTDEEGEHVDGIALVIPQSQTIQATANGSNGTTIARQRSSGGAPGERFSVTFSI